MAGELVYFTVPAADAQRAQAFFGELLGWEFAPGNVPGGFHIVNAKPPGGLFEGGEGTRPRVYFGVDDIRTAVARVRELGGEASEPEAIPSGWMADCRDDQGLEFSLWQGADG